PPLPYDPVILTLHIGGPARPESRWSHPTAGPLQPREPGSKSPEGRETSSWIGVSLPVGLGRQTRVCRWGVFVFRSSVMRIVLSGLFAVAALAAVSQIASAQQPRQGGQRPVNPIVAALDADGDGTISKEELANAVAALKKLDKNGDGVLSGD